MTLLELMIAMLVLAFGLLTVAAAQMHAMRGSRTGRHTTQAAVVAENQMEQLQRMQWTSIPPTNWTAPLTVDNVVEGVGTEIEQSYAVQWRIADVVPGRRRAIDVRVTWSEPTRPNRTYSISSVRYNFEGL